MWWFQIPMVGSWPGTSGPLNLSLLPPSGPLGAWASCAQRFQSGWVFYLASGFFREYSKRQDLEAASLLRPGPNTTSGKFCGPGSHRIWPDSRGGDTAATFQWQDLSKSLRPSLTGYDFLSPKSLWLQLPVSAQLWLTRTLRATWQSCVELHLCLCCSRRVGHQYWWQAKPCSLACCTLAGGSHTDNSASPVLHSLNPVPLLHPVPQSLSHLNKRLCV